MFVLQSLRILRFNCEHPVFQYLLCQSIQTGKIIRIYSNAVVVDGYANLSLIRGSLRAYLRWLWRALLLFYFWIRLLCLVIAIQTMFLIKRTVRHCVRHSSVIRAIQIRCSITLKQILWFSNNCEFDNYRLLLLHLLNKIFHLLQVFKLKVIYYKLLVLFSYLDIFTKCISA